MKIFRMLFLAFFVIILLAAGFGAWLCTGSFTYQNSMQKEFVIDEPVTVVCRRAMHIKPKESQDSTLPRIDMQDAAKNYSLGQPIGIEFDHPELGTVKAGIKINLEMENNSLKIRGKVVSLEPREVKKFGKTVADIENFAFVLKISAKDESLNESGFMRFFSSTSKTVFELSSNSEIRVRFRGLGFVRSQVDQIVGKEQAEMVQKIEKFLDENLRQPGEDEVVEQNAVEEKAQKVWNILKRQKQEVPQKEEQKPEPEKKTAAPNDESIDVSALDEEI